MGIQLFSTYLAILLISNTCLVKDSHNTTL